jgi:hypothetical protein
MILFTEVGNHRIGSIDLNTCKVSTFAGTGNAGFLNARADSAKMDFPRGIVKRGNDYYFCDFNNQKVRRVYLKTITSDLKSVTSYGNVRRIDGNTFYIENPESFQFELYNVLGQQVPYRIEGNFIKVSEGEGMVYLHVK